MHFSSVKTEALVAVSKKRLFHCKVINKEEHYSVNVCGQCPIESRGGYHASATSVVVHHSRLNLHIIQSNNVLFFWMWTVLLHNWFGLCIGFSTLKHGVCDSFVDFLRFSLPWNNGSNATLFTSRFYFLYSFYIKVVFSVQTLICFLQQYSKVLLKTT